MPSIMDIQRTSTENISELLGQIPDAPKSLFFKGTPAPKDATFLAVVGSRQYTDYGKRVCEKLIRELAGYNISIVSGLALGIDSIAHKAALDVGLHTIAVPGSGLSSNVLYPSSHRNLAERIVKNGGLLLSELDPETRAAPYTFPKRNRVIIGLSHGVLIIEAKKKSGTMISARLASEYNRDVLTVPHSIYSTKAEGPHYLLKNGAGLI